MKRMCIESFLPRNHRMDKCIFSITLCILLDRTVIGQMLVSNKDGVIVTSSSQHTPLEKWDVNHAIDGNTYILADNCKCCGATGYEPNPWLKIDLGQNYEIKRIHLIGRPFHGNTLYKMEIQLSTSELDGTVLQGVDTSNENLREFDHTLTSPELTRFITFTLRNITQHLVICELYVYAGEMLISHMEGAGITSSSQHTPVETWDIYHALDGKIAKSADTCKCCGATSDDVNPWFNIDLGQSYRIQRIHVMGRALHPQTLYKMEIQLGTTESGGTALQGVDTSNENLRELDHTLPSPELARFITFTLRNITQHLVICELYVYADCPGGTYGPDCVNTCGAYCVDGRYGPSCVICGQCKNTNECDKISGNCANGCSAGYQGMKCIEVCKWGTYGLGCASTCGKCESNATCNNVDGTCSSCLSGYLTPMCNDCLDGLFGPTCENCGNCNDNGICDKTNGNCPSGCSAGYKGITCKEECEDGTYGLGCRNKCGNCFNNKPCNKIDGGCATCAAGYTGNACVDECLTGTFGFNCKQRCGMCLGDDVCDIYTGDCPNGCTDEYVGSQCLQESSQESSSSSDTRVSLPVYIGSLFAVILVYTIIVLVCVLYRKRLGKNARKAANSEGTSIQLPSSPSNYDTLQFDNPDGESRFNELGRRS